ncbi:MAG: hypothetical protein HY314_00075 [Acidobacteria bacterium]|nr:hypothetical protein [Acidobacteriota bacterium]
MNATEGTIRYDRNIRLRGRLWDEAARRVSLGYKLDPAEHRGFPLVIPEYMVAEDMPRQDFQLMHHPSESLRWLEQLVA